MAWMFDFVSHTPLSLLQKIYRGLDHIPVIGDLMHAGIRSFIPDWVDIPEGKLFLNREDTVVSAMLALHAYENFELDVFRTLISEGMTVVDVGANLGVYTLIASQKVGEKGRVYAFEPEPVNASLLERMIEFNKRENVVVERTGLSDKIGTARLFLWKYNKGHHSILESQEERNGSVEIELTTLDQYVKLSNILRVDFVKIDIEGAEVLALSGMRSVILRDLPTIMMEFSPERIESLGKDPVQVIEDLKDAGYGVYRIDTDAHELSPSHDADVLIHESRKTTYSNILLISTRE